MKIVSRWGDAVNFLTFEFSKGGLRDVLHKLTWVLLSGMDRVNIKKKRLSTKTRGQRSAGPLYGSGISPLRSDQRKNRGRMADPFYTKATYDRPFRADESALGKAWGCMFKKV